MGVERQHSQRDEYSKSECFHGSISLLSERMSGCCPLPGDLVFSRRNIGLASRTKSRYRVSRPCVFRCRLIDEDFKREIQQILRVGKRRIEPRRLAQTRESAFESERVEAIEGSEPKPFRTPIEDFPPQKNPLSFRGFLRSENLRTMPADANKRIVRRARGCPPRSSVGKIDIQRGHIGQCRGIPFNLHLFDSLFIR